MKKILFILTILLALTYTSCQHDDWERGNSDGPVNGLRFSYSVVDPVSVITRSLVEAEDEENKLTSFYILFFENSIDGSGQFIEAIDILSSYSGNMATSGTVDVTFPSASQLKQEGEYRILLCANIEGYYSAVLNKTIDNIEDLIIFCQGKDEKAVNNLMLTISGVQEGEDDLPQINSAKLPMGSAVTKRASETTIEVNLNRLVSRFDLMCEVNGYQLISASIWNANSNAFIWNDYITHSEATHAERFYGVVAENGRIMSSLYAFENSVDEPVQNDRLTTCLIVGLENAAGGREYFRINIYPPTGVGQSLKRNNIYRTIITGVNGIGSATEKEAYERSGEALLETDINGWFTGEGGNVQIKDGKVLAVPTQHIKLYAHGDQRTYYIYTLGEGEEASAAHIHLKGGVADIQLVESEQQQGEVLKKYELFITAGPGTVEAHDPAYVTISFGGMTSTIYITQEQSLGSYLTLTPANQQYFSPTELQSSGDITVNSSGNWKAKIYNGDYFSFQAHGNALKEISGAPGQSFNIHSIEPNFGSTSRYSFVLVYLEDMESVSEAIVLQQYADGEQFLRVDPTLFPLISAGGGSTENITVFASGAWEATITYDKGKAYFQDPVIDDDNDDEEETEPNGDEGDDEKEPPTYLSWPSTRGNSFVVTLDAQTTLGSATTATVTVSLTGTDIKEVFTVKQSSFTEKSIVIQTTSRTKRGSVNDLGRAVTNRYVYNLATNLRNTELFGPNSRIVPMEEGYTFMYKATPNDLASVFQITAATSASIYKNALKNWMNAKSNRFIFFSTSGSYCATNMTRYQNSSAFGNKGFKVANVGANRQLYRKFNPKAKQGGEMADNKLINYLLKDGPFTNGNAINPENLKFQSRADVNYALTDWPDTFIPIIMAAGTSDDPNKNIEKCVFGIDPTNRIIWLSDGGIFGSKKTSDYNYTNFSTTDTQNFLNNFISWLTYAVSMGEIFYSDFQVIGN